MLATRIEYEAFASREPELTEQLTDDEKLDLVHLQRRTRRPLFLFRDRRYSVTSHFKNPFTSASMRRARFSRRTASVCRQIW